MKNLFILIAFLSFACSPINKIAAQSSFGEELLDAFLTGVVEGLFEGIFGGGEEEEEVNLKAKVQSNTTSSIEGIWENGDSWLHFSAYDGFSETSANGGTLWFGGSYKIVNGILYIYDLSGNLSASWNVSQNGSRLTLSRPGEASLTYTYRCSLDAHKAKKDREQANLEANTSRNVTFGQSYNLSKGIRADVQQADLRRSYDTERTKALENAKFWRQMGNEEMARTWEDKAAENAYEIQQLDRNN
jgi:hypothetical protein